MDLKSFDLWMYSNAYAESTRERRISLLRNMGFDLDELGDLEIAKALKELPRKDEAKNNLVKAINLYLKFRNREFRLKYKPKGGEKDLWIPTPDEREKLIGVTWPDQTETAKKRLLLRVLFEGGLRAGEVRVLKYTDVRSRRIDGTDYTYLNVIGKGNKERQVPISRDLYTAIIHYKMFYKERGEYLFANRWNGRAISQNWVGKVCREAGKAAGVKRFHPHAARHYRAVELLKEGVNLEAVRRFLGHSRLNTTQIYLRSAQSIVFTEIGFKDRYFQSTGGGEKVDDQAYP